MFFVLIFVALLRLTNGDLQYCETPSMDPGVCTTIHKCPSLRSMLRSIKERPENRDYLNKSICRYEKSVPIVCCPEDVEDVHKLTLPNDCGRSFNDTSNALQKSGDRLASEGEYPWIVALGYGRPNDSQIKWLCAGTLITTQHVLTTAYCVQSRNDLFKVRANSLNLYESANEGLIYKKVIHEEYNRKSHQNDIAVLTVEWMQFGAHLVPICLTTHPKLEMNSRAKSIVLVDWDMNLICREIPIMSTKKCEQIYESVYAARITDGTLCSSSDETCGGVTGSPLMLPQSVNNITRHFAIGLVSYSFDCDSSKFPNVFTRIYKYVDWIQSNLYV